MQAGLSTCEALRQAHAATDEEILRVQPQRESRAGDKGRGPILADRNHGLRSAPRQRHCFDPFRDVRLGRLTLSKQGLRVPDRAVQQRTALCSAEPR